MNENRTIESLVAEFGEDAVTRWANSGFRAFERRKGASSRPRNLSLRLNRFLRSLDENELTALKNLIR